MSGFTEIDAAFGGATLVLALAILGLGVGMLAGLFGVGGAFVATPMLISVLGIDSSVAVGSSLAFTIGTSATGIWRHRRHKNVEIRSMLTIGLGAVAGTILGAYLHDELHDAINHNGGENFDLVIKVLFIVLLLPTAFLIYLPPAPANGKGALLERLPLPPYIELPGTGMTRVSVTGLFIVGIQIGIFTGLLGIGGGVFLMPMLILVVGLSPHLAVGTSLGAVLLSSIVGTAKYAADGNVNLWIVGILFLGSAFGIVVGTRLCTTLEPARLRRYFCFLVLAVVAVMVGEILLSR